MSTFPKTMNKIYVLCVEHWQIKSSMLSRIHGELCLFGWLFTLKVKSYFKFERCCSPSVSCHRQVCSVRVTTTSWLTFTWAAMPQLVSWWTKSTLCPWRTKPKASRCFPMRKRNTDCQGLGSAPPWDPECTSHPRVLCTGEDTAIVTIPIMDQGQETVTSTALNFP